MPSLAELLKEQGLAVPAKPALADPLAPNFRLMSKPPSELALFGTAQVGRDVLSRVIYGSQTSLLVAVSAVLVAGLTAVALFRSSFLKLKSPEGELPIGPSVILDTLLGSIDREVDRKMATPRAVARSSMKPSSLNGR